MVGGLIKHAGTWYGTRREHEHIDWHPSTACGRKRLTQCYNALSDDDMHANQSLRGTAPGSKGIEAWLGDEGARG